MLTNHQELAMMGHKVSGGDCGDGYSQTRKRIRAGAKSSQWEEGAITICK